MRAHEFIIESGLTNKHGKIKPEHVNSSLGIHKTRDIGGYDRIYHMNRLMMAMACADGKSTTLNRDVDAASWVEKYNTVHPFTEEEHNMLKQAMTVIPTDLETIVPFSKSSENEYTNKTSPIKPFKGYKR